LVLEVFNSIDTSLDGHSNNERPETVKSKVVALAVGILGWKMGGTYPKLDQFCGKKRAELNPVNRLNIRIYEFSVSC